MKAAPSPFEVLKRGHYSAIVADPPWHFRARTALQVRNWTSRRDAERHYAVMGVDDIKALPVSALAAKDAHLFLWTTGPCLRQAFDVIEAWGFRYSAVAFTWIKFKKSHNPLQLRMLPMDEHDLHVGLGLPRSASTPASLTRRTSGCSGTATVPTWISSRASSGQDGISGATKRASSSRRSRQSDFQN